MVWRAKRWYAVMSMACAKVMTVFTMAMRFTIYAGESPVARCPGVPRGVTRCGVDLAIGAKR